MLRGVGLAATGLVGSLGQAVWQRATGQLDFVFSQITAGLRAEYFGNSHPQTMDSRFEGFGLLQEQLRKKCFLNVSAKYTVMLMCAHNHDLLTERQSRDELVGAVLAAAKDLEEFFLGLIGFFSTCELHVHDRASKDDILDLLQQLQSRATTIGQLRQRLAGLHADLPDGATRESMRYGFHEIHDTVNTLEAQLMSREYRERYLAAGAGISHRSVDYNTIQVDIEAFGRVLEQHGQENTWASFYRVMAAVDQIIETNSL